MEKNDEFFLTELIRWYNPHGYIIQNHRNVNLIAREMLQEGYTPEAIYKLVDKAREYWNLPAIQRAS